MRPRMVRGENVYYWLKHNLRGKMESPTAIADKIVDEITRVVEQMNEEHHRVHEDNEQELRAILQVIEKDSEQIAKLERYNAWLDKEIRDLEEHVKARGK